MAYILRPILHIPVKLLSVNVIKWAFVCFILRHNQFALGFVVSSRSFLAHVHLIGLEKWRLAYVSPRISKLPFLNIFDVEMNEVAKLMTHLTGLGPANIQQLAQDQCLTALKGKLDLCCSLKLSSLQTAEILR